MNKLLDFSGEIGLAKWPSFSGCWNLSKTWWDLKRFGMTPDKIWRRRGRPDLPKIFCVSVPKSGTHLLERVLCLHPRLYRKFMSTLFFEPNKSVLKPGGKGILNWVGEALARVEPMVKFIRIDGHTAEASPGNDTVNNRDLSTERANEVLKYLESNYVKDPYKLYAAGFGLHRPVAPNDSEENRAKNRRVEILVGKNDPLQEELDKIYKESD